MILITGAAGKTGRSIIQALSKQGANVRAFVRRPEQVTLVQELGAQEAVVGDIANADDYQRAVVGIETIYHIAPNMHPAEVEIGQIAIAAAQAANVNRIVYHSVLHPQTEKMPHHWQKMRVEELLFESGLDVTILQPAAYMQNILAGWQRIVEQGIYQVPYPIETRLSIVDLNDVAEVTATVLTGSTHSGAVYELAGPEAPSQIEVAEVLSKHLKRKVKAEQVSIDTWRRGAIKAGLGDYQVETLIKMFQYYENYNFFGNSNVLGWLLGRRATSFDQFVQRQ